VSENKAPETNPEMKAGEKAETATLPGKPKVPKHHAEIKGKEGTPPVPAGSVHVSTNGSGTTITTYW
jgi:hypothetical protein